jgi:hypothetical protein
MRTWLVTVAVLACCIVPLRADIRITQSRTVEGRAAVLTPDAGLPRVTMRIKGMKARTDVETYGHTVTAITDVETQQVMMLRTGSNIAQVTTTTPESVAAGGPWQTPHIDVSLRLTGKSRMINGVSCDEHSFTMRMDMASVPNPHIPPEAMKGVSMRMRGSIWIGRPVPGAAEWIAFNKAALSSKLLSAVTGVASEPWMDKLHEVSAAAGIPYLTEMTMRYEGSGPMMDVVEGMGDTKIIQKVTLSTAPIPADLFELPAGYTLQKR